MGRLLWLDTVDVQVISPAILDQLPNRLARRRIVMTRQTSSRPHLPECTQRDANGDVDAVGQLLGRHLSGRD